MPTTATETAPRFRCLCCMLIVLVGVGGCQAPGVGAGAAGGEWYRYRSDHFDVYSRLPERRVAEQIQQLEAFRATVHRLLQIEEVGSFEHDTRLLLLPGQGQLRELFKTSPGVVGFMRPGLRQNLMVAATVSSRLISANEVAFHEYVHYLVRNAGSFRYPAWFDEGFAQMLAASRIEDDALVIGSVPMTAAYAIQRYRMMALDELIGTAATGDLGYTASARFYATSWLLVHYLMLSDDQGLRERTERYLRAYNAGRGAGETFESTVGAFTDLEAAIRDYQHGVPAWNIPLNRVEFEPDYEREPLAPERVAYELAYMVVPHNPAYARALFTSILERDPEDARALAGLGVSHQFDGDYEQAESLMRQAVALDGDDYLLLTELADLLLVRCRQEVQQVQDVGPAVCAQPDVQREARELYRRAQALEPDALETLTNYARALLDAGRPQQALTLLEQAYRLAPSAYPVVLNFGMAHAQAGHWEPAREFLRRAAGWAVDDPEEHARVRGLLRQVDMAAGLESADASDGTD